MGYTHYWNVKRDADREKVAEAGREMGRVVEAARVPLADWNGEGEPDVREDGTVRFNGRGPRDDPTDDPGGETATELYQRVYGEQPDLSGIFDEAKEEV